MSGEQARLRLLCRIGIGLTLLSLSLVAISAYLRLSAAGLGCIDWPACYAPFLAGSAYMPDAIGRIVHRVVATTALLLTIHACWIAWRPYPLQPAALQASFLLGLMLLLSMIGIWSGDPRLVGVNFINMIGGLALVSTSWRLVIASRGGAATAVKLPDRYLASGMTSLTLVLVMGGLIGARYAASACTTLPDCNGRWLPTTDGLPALNVLDILAGPVSAGDAGGAALHLLHRYVALLAVLLLGIGSARALRLAATHAAAKMLLLLLGLEVLLGVMTVASGYGLWWAVGHNIGAASLLACSVHLLHKMKLMHQSYDRPNCSESPGQGR